MKLLDMILEFLRGLATQQALERQAAPGSIVASTTVDLAHLPTLYDRQAEEMIARSRIVTFVRTHLGKRYQFGIEVQPGAEDAAGAWDCSEIVEAAYRRVGLPLPDGAAAQYNACQPVPRPLPGDLGFLWSDARGVIGHVLVCTGEGTVVHAVGGRGVVEDELDRWVRHPRWKGWRRHVDFARPPEDRV